MDTALVFNAFVETDRKISKSAFGRLLGSDVIPWLKMPSRCSLFNVSILNNLTTLYIKLRRPHHNNNYNESKFNSCLRKHLLLYSIECVP